MFPKIRTYEQVVASDGRERLAAEADLAASEEQTATAAATAHEREAEQAREDAVEAARRRRLADQATAERSHSKY